MYLSAKKTTRTLAMIFVALVLFSTSQISTPAQARDVTKVLIPDATPATVGASIAAMPLPFTKNEGQWPDSILFRTNAGGATMWFTKNGIYYQFFKLIEKASASATPFDSSLDAFDAMPSKFGHEHDSIETTMIKAEFVGASESVEVVGLEELEYKCNYFIGNVPSKWRSDVPNFSAVTMRGLYPGVDVTFSTKDGRLQEELSATAVGDLAQVKVEYRGALGVTEQTDNLAIVQTPLGERFFEGVLLSNGQESSLAETRSSASETSSASAVTLIYSTYLGGSGGESGAGIAVDASGNAFVAGYTNSTNFPTLNPYQGTFQGGNDVFVTKLSSTGNSLIYSTYLGGGSGDYGYGIAVDASGNAFVTGYTLSTNFPTLNPYQTDPGDGSADVFVTKLSSTGNSLIYSTYLGGGSEDIGYGIAVDANGNAFVTGQTGSTNFPTLNPYQADPGDGNRDVFVTKLSSTGNSLIYSTYLGGGSEDIGYGIAVDANGNCFVTGSTSSTNFPTLNPYQIDPGDGNLDVFVTKLSSTGNSLIYSTYLGGGNLEVGYSIAVDANGNAFVTGLTYSTNFPTLNPYQTDPGDGAYDVFVTKLSSTGNSLIYSTYLGGGSYDYGFGIAVDASGNCYVTGVTSSTNFPTLNPYQTDPGDGAYDVFVTKLSSTGNSLIYSTYLGGIMFDDGAGITVDASGTATVMGGTGSPDFPIQNPYQAFNVGSNDVFVTKLTMPISCCAIAGNADGDASVSIADAVYLIGYIFLGGPPPPCMQSGDADGDASISIADAVYLIGYIFLGGPAPVCGP